ncbi:MAG: hypothetical protein A2Z99_00730 [Treponema sp. GWB1_62_6]|nr:MAG: hypothetical protein A2001_00185 [Treponema sp. GWC1_61_84]OHE66645.1 MAG: hypothetical protein A2Z99_00730 [Treponema sp. GWB1_62_6]
MKNSTILVLATAFALSIVSCPAESVPDPEVLSSDTALSALTVDGEAADENGGSFGFSVPYATAYIDIAFELATGASASLGGEAGTRHLAVGLNVGANSFSIVVTAEDGTTTATYTLIVTRDPEILPNSINLSYPAADASDLGPRPTFSWGKSAGAVRWKIHLAEGASPSVAPASDYLISPSWTPPIDLNPSMDYAWKVVPYDAAGTELTPSESRIFRTGFLSEAPTGLVVTQVADKPHLSIEWIASVGAERYKIFRNRGSVPIYVIGAENPLVWIDGFPNSGINTYTVRASNDFGDSGDSNEASGTPIDSGFAIVIFK